MAKKKQSKPEWFKDKALAAKDLFLNTPDATMGKVYKMAVMYFDKGEITDIDNLNIQDPFVKVLFSLFKQWCDDALKDYQSSVEFGKKGADARWNKEDDKKDSPPIPPL